MDCGCGAVAAKQIEKSSCRAIAGILAVEATDKCSENPRGKAVKKRIEQTEQADLTFFQQCPVPSTRRANDGLCVMFLRSPVTAIALALDADCHTMRCLSFVGAANARQRQVLMERTL